MNTDWVKWQAEGAVVRGRLEAYGVTEDVVDLDVLCSYDQYTNVSKQEERRGYSRKGSTLLPGR